MMIRFLVLLFILALVAPVHFLLIDLVSGEAWMFAPVVAFVYAITLTGFVHWCCTHKETIR